MSWVHPHKKSPSSSLSSTSSSLNVNNSFNFNSQQQLHKRNQTFPRQASSSATATPAFNTQQQQQSLLLMTSPYSNKSNNISLKPTSLSSSSTTAVPTTMRSNQLPYQTLQQQQQQQLQQLQQPLSSQPPQRNQQHALQPTSQPPPSTATTSSLLNTSSSHLQGVFNNQQHNSWSKQPLNYLTSTKMMQPTPPLTAGQAAGANNNWPQQQQPQQQQPQNFQNVAMYPQNTTQQQKQQWPQNPQQQQPPPAAATYDNYYQQQQPNNMYQQQPTHPVAQQNPATYFQQQPQVAQTQQPAPSGNAVNFFDNANSNNNQSTGADGWGDWDWNDNSTTASTNPEQQQLSNEQHHQMQQPTQQHVANTSSAQQQQGNFNAPILSDSFNSQNNNKTWNWSTKDNEQQHHHLDNAPKTQNDNWNWSTAANEQQHQVAPPPPAVADVNQDQHNDNWNWQATNENQQLMAATQNVGETKNASALSLDIVNASENVNQIASPPPPPPPTEFSSSTSENHNYNTNNVLGAAPPPPSTSNIPNPVFVTQAKPVTLPSRQFASPPSGNTPVSENPPETALMPPQGFQNVEDSIIRPTATVSPALPPPPPAGAVGTPLISTIPPPAGIPPASGMPPASVMPPAATSSANPFKRAGIAQHHRATGLMATSATTTSSVAPAPAMFTMAPPPPVDFANPSTISLMEPENNELPAQENQEVLLPTTSISLPPTSITLPNATASNITLPNASSHAQQPPPNDERNQYLQTSHLSENSEEQQPEADGLLPPPGLSRLVLGEPELEASQQRMVMGTESSALDNVANQAAAMHLEERHADGEDTASENAVPVISSSGQGVPPLPSSLSSDRNLYLVPGESNSTSNQQQQQQRVVTGVELAEQREIEMDGENLEDEQIQQQQQQQHLHQQQHLQHQMLSPEGRNEPPVEGADEIVEQTTLATSTSNHPAEQHLEQHHHHHHTTNQSVKTKDPNPISSPNDDDDSDERLDRGINQSTAGSSKSRSKYDNERMATNSSRRREKRSSVQRYESDEYLNSEGEYSSDREERERRERDRRRNYREGSVRSERNGSVDLDNDGKRSRRHRNSDKRDKYYYDEEERNRAGDRGGERDLRERGGGDRSKGERRSQRQRGYDADSRYETEESTRFDTRKESTRRSMRHPEAERQRRSDRSDQGADYDDYNRRGYRPSKRSVENYESDRRDRGRVDKLRDKLRDPRYRDDPRWDPREYEDYRKHSSRNARESDLEKEGGPSTRPSGRSHHDPRHAAAAAMYGYPSGGYYDPYTAYYYQQMARTNPQAYAEWYKKYYGQAAATAAGVGQGAGGMQGAPNAAHADTSISHANNDGRESVHSGRSSAHNDIKDRYTHAYITQANDYHRHYHQQQHHQQQQQMAFNQSLNSTMLDEDCLNHNASLYGGGVGGMSSARSNSNLSQIHGGYYHMPGMMPTSGTTGSTVGGVYYARSDYAESRSGALSLRDPDPIANEPQRLTPCKFITEHTVVSFASAGVLVTVKPKYTPHGNISNVVKLLKFKPNDETRKLFKVFPGPLVRGLTHKKTVIEFCNEQIRLGPMETTIYAKQLITNNAEKYRGSYTLMWNLLILLLKQNGMVVGTDIAELLLKNQQQFPYQTPNSTLNSSLKSKSGSTSPADDVGDIDTHKEQDNNDGTSAKSENLDEPVTEDKEKLIDDENEEQSLTKSASGSASITENEVTEKFRNYLLYGNVNEALEWATDNNLWGHALFLASKLDRRSHANVMMKFANKLSLNDPLQTLYQLMSGRTPSSVTCIQDEKWGDWRPHLSMILSNTSQKPELDRKAITTLGDSLFNRGDLYASHFCYLMAQVSFGRYQETATQETTLQQHLPKLILLGSSHYKQFHDFAHNEAIIMTEIYEYACSLNDDKFSIVEFQPYKFLLATRLLDYGFHLKSLMYLEQIAVHIARDATKYESSFINKVYEMADRLKYYDPVLEKTIDDQLQQPGADDINGLNAGSQQQMEEQKWLQNLRELAQQYKNDYASNVAGITAAAATPNNIQQDTQQQQQHHLEPNYNYQQQQIDQQFMEINKQFSDLNLQYQNTTATGTTEEQQHQQQQQPMFYNTEQQAMTQTAGEQPQSLDPYHQPLSLQPELPLTNAKDLQQQPEIAATQPINEVTQDPYHQQQQYMQPTDANQGYHQNYYDPSQHQQQQPSYNSVDSGNLDHQQQPASYDYWAQQQQQPSLIEENARPTISMPKSKTYDSEDDGGAGKKQQQLGNDAKKQQQAQKGAKKEDKDANKGLSQSNQSTGWFGWFSFKPKNQMILPDDKNPSIVWDPEKKKWVNTDGEEAEQESFKPPPKMSDIMPPALQTMPAQQPPTMPMQQQQSQQQNPIPFMDPQQMQQQQYVPNSIPNNSAPSPNPLQQQQPQLPSHQQQPSQTQPQLANNQQSAAGPAKTPNLQSNMFKMQRNRTLKNAYVDVFNPSGAPVNKAAENILAPALPPATVPQGSYFVPGAQPTTGGGSQDQQYQQQQQQPQQQETPNFYNPNQFTSGTGY